MHESFHRHGARIGELIMKGSQFEAVTVFSNEMQAAADEIFGHLEALRAEALRAEEIYDGMNRQAMGPCVERQRAALDLLEQLVSADRRGGGRIGQGRRRGGGRLRGHRAGRRPRRLRQRAGAGVAAERLHQPGAASRHRGSLRGGRAGCVGLRPGVIGREPVAGRRLLASRPPAIEETSSSLEEMSSMTKQQRRQRPARPTA
ncbi:MAG: hypothetical protein MZU95_13470 [Desulfomicrobium escambiense]|nr:hypothetical protein [Desulfomicrobium escambiense]